MEISQKKQTTTTKNWTVHIFEVKTGGQQVHCQFGDVRNFILGCSMLSAVKQEEKEAHVANMAKHVNDLYK